jgi:hypothetical protein
MESVEFLIQELRSGLESIQIMPSRARDVVETHLSPY